MNAASTRARLLLVLPLLALLWVAWRPLERTWRSPVSHDLDTYVAAGRVWRQGGDPYDFASLDAASTADVRAFVYPRAVLPALAPLGGLDRLGLARGWALAQAAALAALLGIGAWGAGRPGRGALAALAAVLAWDAAVRAVLVQGNVEAFVALGVALALVGAGRRRGGVAGVLLGASAAFKLWPIALAAVPGAREGRVRRVLGAGAVAAAVVAVELAASRPFLLWREVRHMDDRGPVEPSLRALLADLVQAHVLPQVTAFWALAALAVTAVTVAAARRAGPGAARDALVWLAVLVLVPRVQDYGWVHALVPAAWAWSAHPAAWVGAVVAAAGHALGWRYAAWVAAAATWAGLAGGLILGGRRPASDVR